VERGEDLIRFDSVGKKNRTTEEGFQVQFVQQNENAWEKKGRK